MFVGKVSCYSDLYLGLLSGDDYCAKLGYLEGFLEVGEMMELATLIEPETSFNQGI